MQGLYLETSGDCENTIVSRIIRFNDGCIVTQKGILANVNQSIIVFCPRAGLSLHTQHSPLYPLLSLPFRIFIQSIYHNVVYHLISYSASNFLPFTIPSRASFSRQFLLSQWHSKYFSLFFISSSIILPSPTLSSTTEFFILSVHFTRSITHHIHISKASSRFCSFCRSVQISAPFNTTLHTKHFTSPVVLFSRARRKCFFSC